MKKRTTRVQQNSKRTNRNQRCPSDSKKQERNMQSRSGAGKKKSRAKAKQVNQETNNPNASNPSTTFFTSSSLVFTPVATTLAAALNTRSKEASLLVF